MTTYKAVFIEEAGEKTYSKRIVERSVDDLPEGDLLVKVHYSSLNQKDAMSAHGNKGVTRNFPHQPGIDAAGIVEASSSADFSEGDKVIVTGYDLGMNTAGGLGEYIRVPAQWALECPTSMSLKQSMQFGTAGLTAALCIDKLEQSGLDKSKGPVLVTGATGGVASIAIVLLAEAGYEVVASTGKTDQTEFLQSLGASAVIDRAELSEENKRPMLKGLYAGAIDVVGGHTLANAIKSLQPGCSVACCGLVQSPSFDPSVFPFILRGVNLLGVDSVEIPLSKKAEMWEILSRSADSAAIAKLNEEIGLEQVPDTLDRLHSAGMIGHAVVNVAAS